MVENEEVETPYYGPLPLGGDVPYFRKTGVTRRAETFYTTGHEPGGKFWLQREAEAEAERTAIAERERISAYLDLQASQARARTLAETKAREESRQRAEDLRLQQRARATGISIQRVKQQQVQQRAEEQLVIKAAEDIRASGKAFSQTEYRQELARRSGLDPSKAIRRLQTGTAREKKVFKVTGISLEEERRETAEAQTELAMLRAGDREGSSFMEPRRDFTDEERMRRETLAGLYENDPTIISKTWTAFSEGLIQPIVFGGMDLYRKATGEREPPEKEAFKFTPETEILRRETISYGLAPPERISKPAQYYRASTKEEITAGLKYETELETKRQKILSKIEAGGITEKEAVQANLELFQFAKTKEEEYKKEFETREEARQKKYFPKDVWSKRIILGIPILKQAAEGARRLPEWEADPVSIYESEVLGIVPRMYKRPITKGVMFVGGAYRGLREHPEKTLLTAGVMTAITVTTAGAGAVIGKTSLGAVAAGYPKATALIGKGIQYGLAGAYGASVAARLALTAGTYEKYAKAGEITSTELLPMYAGIRFGAYGVGRVRGYAQLKVLRKQLPLELQKEFISEMKFAKQLTTQPEVSELSLKRLKIVEKYPQIEKPLLKFLRQRQLIVGGSIAQQTQMMKAIKTKRPADIDIYVRRLIGEELGARRYAREMKGMLKGYGIKDLKLKGEKVYVGVEKLAEFHPYKTYLKANIEWVIPWYRTARAGIIKTPSGAKVMRLQIQLQRKLIGGYLEPYATGKLRLKDIPAAKAIRESLVFTKRTEKLVKFSLGDLKIKGTPQFMSLIKTEAMIRLPKGLKTTDILKGLDISGRGEPLGKISKYPYYKAKAPSVYPFYKPAKKLPTFTYEPIKLKEFAPILPKYKPVKPRRKYVAKRKKREPYPFLYKPTEIKKILPTILYPELITPKEPFKRTELLLLGGRKQPKRKKKEVKGKFRDDLFYVPSMTAHVLGIKKVMSEKEMLRKAELGITLREVPIIR